MRQRKLRILLIGINYVPEETGIAPYTAGLAEHLADRGHSVVAVTGLPSYPQWRVYDGYRRLLWKRESVNSVDVRRRWHHVPGRSSAIHRGLYEGTFLLTGLSVVGLPRPDAVVGVVPSLSGGLLARLAAWRFRVPYGLVFQDLVGQAARQSGVGGGGRVARGVRAAEGWAARGAAAVGIIAEGFRPYLESLGVDAKRIHRVRNWTHVEAPTMDRGVVRERLGLPHDAIVCLHAGNMGHKQGLENVVECARWAAQRDERLLFVLLGDGNQRSCLEQLAAGYALPNVCFLPTQPASIFPSILAAADILLVNQRGSVCDMSLPSKLTSYFAVGKPLVAAVQLTSEAAREIEASGSGVVVAPDEPKVLLDALQRLADDEDLCAQMGKSAHTWSATELSKAAAMNGYKQLLNLVLTADSRGSTAAETLEEVQT
jgi:colanic acid biosynthesis glycosyl transferase WcaI